MELPSGSSISSVLATRYYPEPQLLYFLDSYGGETTVVTGKQRAPAKLEIRPLLSECPRYFFNNICRGHTAILVPVFECVVKPSATAASSSHRPARCSRP